MRDKIIEAVRGSISKADAIRRMGWPENGAAYKRMSKYIDQFQIDTTHFLKSWQISNLRQFGVIRKYELVDKECPICGCVFQTYVGHPREKTVCSHACSNTHFRSGEQNGNYKDGLRGGPKYRTVCFEYWDKVCAIPGCDWTLVLDVHHVDGNHQNDGPKNLIPLCPNHHRLLTNHTYRDEWDQKIAELVAKKWS